MPQGKARQRAREVRPDVILHDFRHQAVHGAPCRGNAPENLAAFHFVVERPGDRIDLAADAGDAFRQLGLLPNRVRHR